MSDTGLKQQKVHLPILVEDVAGDRNHSNVTLRGTEILHRIRMHAEPIVLEIGVLRGQLMECLLRHRPDLRYVGIDSWREGHDKNYEVGALASAYMATMCRATPYRERVSLFLGDSADTMRAMWGKVRFNLVFIDADHTYEGVMRDILAALPLVAPGCWIGGHDYGDKVKSKVPGVMVGVKKAVDELEDRRILAVVEHGSNSTWFARKEF